MEQSLAKRRMADNESVFRHFNEQVQQGFEAVNKLAEDANQQHLIYTDDTPLHFYCECSDENCKQRIPIKPTEYVKIHLKRDQFIVIPGHQTEMIETVVKSKAKYSIVKKFIKPSENARILQPTSVNNT